MRKRSLLLVLITVILFVSTASGQVTSSDPNIQVSLLKSGLSGPTGLAFRPLSLPQPTHDLVVGQNGTNTVPRVDAITGVTTAYVSQTAPSFVAVRASDDLVAVTPQSADVVNFYDTTGGAPKGTISAGFAGGPTSCLVGVAFDSAGNFYVATGTSTAVAGCPSQVSAGSSSIYEFAGPTPYSGAVVTLIASGLDALQGLAFSAQGGPSGSLFAVSNFDGNIYQEVLGAAPTATPLATDPSGGTGDPTGITVDPVKGDVYITEFTGGTVTKLKIPALTFSTKATGFTNPSGLGFDTGGNAYVADFGTGDIWKFTRPWLPGDVFVAVGNAQYNVYHNKGTAGSPNYVLSDTINDGTGGFFTTGCGFDSASNLFTTNFDATKVLKFDANAHIPVQTIDTNAKDTNGLSESVVLDSVNNLYVGDAGGGRLLLKYDSTGAFVKSFTPASEVTGTDWAELSADQKTVFYTSEGTHVKRFDVSGVGTQLTDFNSTALPGSSAFALRLLPPFDGSGGLLVADSNKVRRLDSTGAVIQTYDAACTLADPCGEGGRSWFALNLDPNGTSFWAGDPNTGDVFRFNIASGAIEFGPIKTPAGSSPDGICVKGEPAAVNSTVLTFPAGTTTTQTATFNAGMPDEHEWKANLTANNTFSITVTAHEVTCDTGVACNGDDFNGDNNYRCRWDEYFSQDPELPIGIPYSNGNCVYYRVENPPPNSAIGSEILFSVAYHDPPGTPANTPYCSTLNGGPFPTRLFRDPSQPPPADAAANHSFAFDFTSAFDETVFDPTLHGKGGTFNDYAAACRATTGSTASWLRPLGGTSKAGSSINLRVRVTSPNGTAVTDAATSPNSMPLSIKGPETFAQTLGASGGFWSYDGTDNWYTGAWSSPKTPTGTYTLCVSSVATDYSPFSSVCTTVTLK